jgi:hypothetical protein
LPQRRAYARRVNQHRVVGEDWCWIIQIDALNTETILWIRFLRNELKKELADRVDVSRRELFSLTSIHEANPRGCGRVP